MGTGRGCRDPGAQPGQVSLQPPAAPADPSEVPGSVDLPYVNTHITGIQTKTENIACSQRPPGTAFLPHPTCPHPTQGRKLTCRLMFFSCFGPGGPCLSQVSAAASGGNMQCLPRSRKCPPPNTGHDSCTGSLHVTDGCRLTSKGVSFCICASTGPLRSYFEACSAFDSKFRAS